MPTILIHVPEGSFSGDARVSLIRRVNDAAAHAEQIPDEPRKRALCWVLIREVPVSSWTCGGADVGSQMLPCMAMIYLPVGVLDKVSRADYVRLMHEAFKQSMPVDEARHLATSVVLHEVDDGSWGVNGAIWTLPSFAHAAGFAHLRHLVTPL